MQRLCFGLVGQGFDEKRACQRINRVGNAAFVRDDLLRAQGNGHGLGAGQGQRFIHRVGMQGLCAAHDGRQGLNRDAHDVVLRLLRGQADAGRLRMETQHPGAWVLGAIFFPQDARPDAAAGAIFGDFLEEVIVRIEEEGKARGKIVHLHPPRKAGIHISQAIGQGEGQLLHRRAAGFADVIARNADGVPQRHVLGAKLDRVHDQAHGMTGWEEEFFLGDELFENVVLQRPA